MSDETESDDSGAHRARLSVACRASPAVACRASPAVEQVYVLELEEGKIYVGRSAAVGRRLDAHIEGRGSRWTQKYPVVRRLDLLSEPGGDPKSREIAETLHWAKLRGVANVRGAHWCRVNPPPAEERWMRQQVYGFFDLCYVCGRRGHFARHCSERPTCAHCGRRSHVAAQCRARGTPELRLWSCFGRLCSHLRRLWHY